jgi:glyceraldehyde 3-phosphate dehydrogenase
MGRIFCFQEENPADIPWQKVGADIVIESTGKMKERNLVAGHLKNGVKKVIVSYPLADADKVIIFGVNQNSYNPQKDQVISNASCTTNCLAILCKILDDEFTIKRGYATTCHAPTMSQRILDGSSKRDKRRGRTAFLNIIPTTTGAAKMLGRVIPNLSGKIESLALRVPVADVSIMDLAVETEKRVTVQLVIEVFKKAAQSKELKGILEIAEHELVSQDIIGRSASAIFDPNLTRVIKGDLVKIFGWYDNEWGYSCRLIDLILYLFQKGL